MNEAVVIEYVDLRAQVAAEVLFSEEVEQGYYDRLDQLWYIEMTEDDRAEALRRLSTERHGDDHGMEKS